MFFGCENTSKGHYLWDTTGSKARNGSCPWNVGWFDGTLNLDGFGQGVAALHHIKGYTLLAFADYSVDSRPGSNAVFALPGTFDFETAKREAARMFPHIWKRFDYPIVERRP